MEAILNHLWQSTAFAGVAWLLTLAIKKNRAQTRYWVWFAASMKFLVPMALLVAVGSQVSWRTAPALSVPNVVEQLGQPFGASAPSIAVRQAAPARTNPLPELLLLVWACGFIVIVARWGRRWTRMHADVRQSPPMDLGLPVLVKSSGALREPGVFGILRPVLLLPEGIAERLTPAQLDAILAHEMCHVRRRDNLMTAMHMVVEAVFWFHPLVWWIGARLMEEREGACDEEVLRSGNDAQTYAEGILKVCEFYLKSPLECVAGVSGTNLSKRIEEIMTNRIAVKLNGGRKLLLAGAGMLAVVGPLMVGLMNAPPIRAQAPSAAGHFEFEVASVKPHKNSARADMRPPTFSGGRFTSTFPVLMVIAAAYDLPLNPSPRLSGGPDWIRGEDGVYDIEATGVIPAGLTAGARDERQRLMLQALLADRFRLVIHREAKEMPVYALVVNKGGPKLEKADVDEKGCRNSPAAGQIPCHQFNGGIGRGMHARAVSIGDMASWVQNWADRPLLNKTGLEGLYKIETQPWLPMQLMTSPPPPGTKGEAGIDLADLPTLFQVFERMGLKMEPTKEKVDVYIIDHIEKPTPN